MKLRVRRSQVIAVVLVLAAFFAVQLLSGRSFEAGPRFDDAQASQR